MADEKKFNLLRKQDGVMVGPVTASEAADLAGYPADFEKVPEPKPLVIKETNERASPRASEAKASAAARKITRRASRAAKAAPAASPAPSAPAAGDTAPAAAEGGTEA